jgi:hypothetical protein
MRVVALLPVRNEAWVLSQALACLSGFCDAIFVGDQQSSDESRTIARQFSKVTLIESQTPAICEQARWQLWDAARAVPGSNLIWCTDADELVSPGLVRAFLQRDRDKVTPGTIVECEYYHCWSTPGRYRDAGWPYAPYWKPVAIVDDRRVDYRSDRELPLHEERVPVSAASPKFRAARVPILHLQWLLPNRMQMRQAWYRCREWMESGRTPADINQQYSVALPSTRPRTRPVPAEWVKDVSFPDLAIDREPAWQEAEILRWFAARGPEFFEPLEIWHVPSLRAAFQREVGRVPRPDRSYQAPWPERVRRAARRIAGGAKRRAGAVLR